MSKSTNQAEKQTLLAKMERDRCELVDAISRDAPQSRTSKGWASSTALAAGAVMGWPRFLKKPLRAMAAVALRDRVADILSRRNKVRDHAMHPDPEIERLAHLTADLRRAVAQAARIEDVEQIHRKLDEQVHRLRKIRAQKAVHCSLVDPAAPIVDTSAQEPVLMERIKAPPSGYLTNP